MQSEHPLLDFGRRRLGPVVEEETFARLCRSRDFLAASLDQPVRLTDAAGEACLSPYHYHRMFARAFGETPHDFVQRLRLDRARSLPRSRLRKPAIVQHTVPVAGRLLAP